MWPLRLSGRQRQGQLWEGRALHHLEQHGLTLVEANYRCKSGEIDLVCRDGECWVFVEVRQRANAAYGGAAASIGARKQSRIVRAAHTYLMRFPRMPACRIDVVAVDGGQVHWLRGAIEV